MPNSKFAKNEKILQALNKDGIKSIKFISTLEDYSVEYTLGMVLEMKSGKQINLEKKINLTEVYDAKGYQHRYIIKTFLDGALDQLAIYFEDK